MVVAYFLEESSCVKIQLYNSVAFTVLNAKTLCFSNDNISFINLISNLSDSFNYNRGEESGCETVQSVTKYLRLTLVLA